MRTQVRRRLLDGRSGSWLLQPQHQRQGDLQPEILDPEGCGADLPATGRASLAALVQTLGEAATWDTMSVGLYRDDDSVSITVVATGSAAAWAASDDGVVTAAARLTADVTLEDASLLVVDAHIKLDDQGEYG